jgi:hypothetical protein
MLKRKKNLEVIGAKPCTRKEFLEYELTFLLFLMFPKK